MTSEVTETAPLAAHPWRTIWLSPRRTMREVLASEVRPGWALVVGLGAVHGALATLGGLSAKGELSFNLAAMPTIIGVLQVVFGVLIGPFLLAFSGGWFGGQADPEEIRQSVAWSYAPFAVTAICWLPVLMAGGPTAPQQVGTPSGSEILKALLLLAVTCIYIAAALWTFVLQVITLAEVQHFSIPRALGSIVIWAVPFLLLALLT